jgi:branched-chain amino acid transport system permease protein
MAKFLQQVIDGIASGCIYAAVALALTFVYRATHIINFAQGEMAMFATFLSWSLAGAGWPIWAAIGASMAIAFVGGALIERVLVRPFEKGSVLTIVIVTLGLAGLVNSLAGLKWGYILKEYPNPFPRKVFAAGRVRYTSQSIGVAVVLAVIVIAVYFLFQHTKIGLAMRAVASNTETSKLVGIRIGVIFMLGWGISAALGAVAGAMVAPKVFLDPNMMGAILLYAFAASTLGGFDSPLGAVVGGLIVGVSENLAGTYIHWIGTDLKVAVPLLIIFIVLLVRPQGLFGKAQVARV